MVSDEVSRFDHFPGDIGASEELYSAGAVGFSNEGAQFEEAGFQTVLAQDGENLFGVFWVGSVIEGQRDRLGGKLGAEDFLASVASAQSAGGLPGGKVAELAENRFPGIVLAETGDVGIPLLARARTASRGELREDASHFLAVGQLNGLQVIEQRRRSLVPPSASSDTRSRNASLSASCSERSSVR